ncbi:hypothetical protein RMATCC62417_11018 [Rhizopus microsporus]|nr:hypothetical protein RMATCC62417_11018 [Rhizopus microsporus]
MRKSLLAVFFAIAGVFCQNADEYKIQSLPGIDITTLKFSQYAGHIELSKKSNSNIFFWMVEQEEKTDPQKLIIWLNGGPGCSSMDGLFLENGPFRVKKDLSLSINKGGWQKYATNIYVDQPVGTGYSFADWDSYMHNMTQITEEFVQFMDKLYEIFPKLRQQDLYIAGESFAGSYIPYFANRIPQPIIAGHLFCCFTCQAYICDCDEYPLVWTDCIYYTGLRYTVDLFRFIHVSKGQAGSRQARK